MISVLYPQFIETSGIKPQPNTVNCFRLAFELGLPEDRSRDQNHFLPTPLKLPLPTPHLPPERPPETPSAPQTSLPETQKDRLDWT